MRIVVLLFTLLLPGLVQAGAWPRDEGRFFIAVSQRLSGDPAAVMSRRAFPETSTNLYAEYGLTPALTFGGSGLYDPVTQRGDVSAFLRYGIARGRHRLAFSVGGGIATAPTIPYATLALHWGRGVSFAKRDGWVGLDLMTRSGGPNGAAIKADATLGLAVTSSLKLALQVQAGQYTASPGYIRAGALAIWTFTKGRSLTLALDRDFAKSAEYGVSVGLWQEF